MKQKKVYTSEDVVSTTNNSYQKECGVIKASLVFGPIHLFQLLWVISTFHSQ